MILSQQQGASAKAILSKVLKVDFNGEAVFSREIIILIWLAVRL
jgi:hypothetical protein